MQTEQLESMEVAADSVMAREEPKQSYSQILKSSGMIGSASLINISFRIVRTKAMALLLGPSGVGLLSLYFSISDMATILAGMGLNSSGVRQIAEAVGTKQTERVARTVAVLRRVALILGVIGALSLAALCRPVARITFGDYEHTAQVALLSVVVLLGVVTSAQAALIQGMRRIGDLARMNVLGAFFGTVFSIAIVYFLRKRGLVLALVCVSATALATSWWYSRKITIARVRMTWKQVRRESSELLKLGVAMMGGTTANLMAAYLVRIIIRRGISLAAIGFYQAAWVLGGIYVDFILQAMGADFYPRLTAVANDHRQCNRLVNEQTEVGLLLAGPGLLATLTFAPVVISLLYTGQFQPAVAVFRWICLGMMLRVVTWPMGFIQIAKGKKKLYLALQLVASILQVAFVWVGLRLFGLVGTGIAFFALWIVHLAIVRFVAGRLTGFSWSSENRSLALKFVALTAIVFGSWYLLSRSLSMVLGTGFTILAGIYSVRTLYSFLPEDRIPRFVQKLASMLWLAPAR